MPLFCTVNEILSLISQNLNRSRDSKRTLSGVIYRARSSTPVCQSAHKIRIAYLHQFQIHNWGKFKKKRVTWPWSRSSVGNLSSQG